jgi:MFS family permease
MELKYKQRFALSAFFFLSGICFSSWTSRIPTIKSTFDYNEAQLGNILITMPICSLIGLPISGWLVSRFDSRVPLAFAFGLLAVAVALIGFSTSTLSLVAAIGLFSFSMRILNISMNTQAITLQKQFERKINGSFHGLWSAGGIVGVAFSTVFVAYGIEMWVHLLIISILTVVTTFLTFPSLIQNDRSPSGNKLQLTKPDPYIVFLGLLVFFAAICEGGMFDWSGIYFKEIVREEVFTIGYLLFMIFMATSRFASDRIVEKIGMPKTYMMSAALISSGVLLAVIFPYFWTALFGFCLIGFGTASVIPMTYLLAGGSKKYSPGMAISIIATYSIMGMLIGPPMIGYLAHAFNLKIAFIAFAISGLMLIPISQRFFNHQGELEK